MQRIKKTARITPMEFKPVRDEVRRGVRAYRATKHATTGVSPNNLMFGRELRGKFPEVNRQPKHQNDTMIRSRDREQKEKMKKYADKRRHSRDENQSGGYGIVQARTKEQPNASL